MESVKIDTLLLYGLGKQFSLQSTRLIDELKNSKQKHHYQQATKYVDKFIDVIEKGFKTDQTKVTQELLVDDMNNWIEGFRKELLNLK